jgi:hypothetical protein
MQESDEKISVTIDYNNDGHIGPVEVLLNPQTNELLIQINAVAVQNYLLSNHTLEDITPQIELSAYQYFIEEGRKIVLNKDINSWGNIRERFENVHDNSVNISLKTAYQKLLAANQADEAVKDKPIHIKNILSYLHFYNLNLTNNEINLMKCLYEWNTMFEAFVSCEESELEDAIGFNYDDKMDFIKDIKRMRSFFDKEIDKIKRTKTRINNCVFILEYVEKHNEFVMNVNDTEINVLTNVWKRIHSPRNAENLNNLLEQFCHEIALLVENEKKDSVQCVSGRVASMISALELFDCDNIVDIKSVPVLRVMMIQNRAPVVIDQLINEYRNLGNNVEVERYLLNCGDCDDLVDFVKQGVIRILTEEFGDKLSHFHMDRFLMEILNEI